MNSELERNLGTLFAFFGKVLSKRTDQERKSYDQGRQILWKYKAGTSKLIIQISRDEVFVYSLSLVQDKDYFLHKRAIKLKLTSREMTINNTTTKSQELDGRVIDTETTLYTHSIIENNNSLTIKKRDESTRQLEVPYIDSPETSRCISEVVNALSILDTGKKSKKTVKINRDVYINCIPPSLVYSGYSAGSSSSSPPLELKSDPAMQLTIVRQEIDSQKKRYDVSLNADEHSGREAVHTDRSKRIIPSALRPHFLSSSESEIYYRPSNSKRGYRPSEYLEVKPGDLKEGYIYLKPSRDEYSNKTYIQYTVLTPQGEPVVAETSLMPASFELKDLIPFHERVVNIAFESGHLSPDAYTYYEGIGCIRDTQVRRARVSQLKAMSPNDYRYVSVPKGSIGLILFKNKPEFLAHGEHLLFKSESSLKDADIQIKSISEEHIVHGDKHILNIRESRLFYVLTLNHGKVIPAGELKFLKPGVHTIELGQKAIVKAVASSNGNRATITLSDAELQDMPKDIQPLYKSPRELVTVIHGKFGIKENRVIDERTGRAEMQLAIMSPGKELLDAGSIYYGSLSAKNVQLEFSLKNVRTLDNRIVNLSALVNYRIISPYHAVLALACNTYDEDGPKYDLDKIEKLLTKKASKIIVDLIRRAPAMQAGQPDNAGLLKLVQEFPPVEVPQDPTHAKPHYMEISQFSITSMEPATLGVRKKLAELEVSEVRKNTAGIQRVHTEDLNRELEQYGSKTQADKAARMKGSLARKQAFQQEMESLENTTHELPAELVDDPVARELYQLAAEQSSQYSGKFFKNSEASASAKQVSVQFRV